ncbi:interleukin-6 [Aquarana catesbeiana]|uniref:interleukin-6 n=1 Tax=Aquarana catesbeiana TaxID=8400 RepID=UPI003CC92EE2
MAGTSFYSTSIQLSVCLAITILVKSVSSAPVSVASSGDTGNKNSVADTAKIIAEEARELYEEVCKTPNLCTNSMEHNLKQELNLPQITNRCLSKQFNKDECLPKIHRDLLRFQKYLTFLKKALKSEKEKVESVQHKTKTLAEAIKNMEKNLYEEKEVTGTDIPMENLPSKDAWSEKLTTYLILQSFRNYMINTSRAIRNSSG